jgi:hypothetical protein
MCVHRGKVEVDCTRRDIFCKDPYGKVIHIHAFHSSTFSYNSANKGDQPKLVSFYAGSRPNYKDGFHSFSFSYKLGRI